jgi:uncharacterized protein (TIGR03435 family)
VCWLVAHGSAQERSLSGPDRGQRPVILESVSIRPSTGRAISIAWSSGGRFSATNVPLTVLLEQGLRTPAFLFEGLPDWVGNARFDITAVAGFDPTPDERFALIRAMLRDRFRLTYRVEQKAVEGFSLRLARADGRIGSGLRTSTIECPDLQPVAIVNTPPVRPGERRRCAMAGGVGTIAADAIPLSELTMRLTRELGQYVEDGTGLSGRFDVDLSYATPAKRDAPPMRLALEQQLGLVLAPAQVKAPIVIVENLERPARD